MLGELAAHAPSVQSQLVVESPKRSRSSSCRWWFVGLLVGAALSAARPAPAQSSRAELARRLDECQGLPTGAKVTRYEEVGEDVVHVVARGGKRYLVFPQADDGCEIYPVGRAAASASGAFGKGTKLFALMRPRCSGETCTVALALRGKADLPVLALRTNLRCDAGLTLRTLKVFADHDSALATCRTRAGAGYIEEQTLFDAVEDTLAQLASVPTGSSIVPSPAERRSGACASHPVGWLKVEKAGAAPLLRVLAVDDTAATALRDGKGTLPARQLSFDARKLTFSPSGAADAPTAVDSYAGCRRP